MKMKTNIERIYVKVNSDFDATGYMTPKAIIWPDGHVYPIDAVKDFRPADSLERGHSGDCYTVVVRGVEKHLFFEKTSGLFCARVGRWFVERPAAG